MQIRERVGSENCSERVVFTLFLRCRKIEEKVAKLSPCLNKLTYYFSYSFLLQYF